MKSAQQKNKDSDDEFEVAKQQIEMFTTHRQQPSPKTRDKKHPRIKNMSEKHKLGLLLTPAIESPYHLAPTKQATSVHGKILKLGSATFRSNFECGNIGTVQQIGNNIFKISLDLESNSLRNNSWFYFSVEGLKGEAQFIIGGFTKHASLYNEGMRICYRDSRQSPKWRRGGTHISYTQSLSETDEDSKKYELKFTHFFRNHESCCVEFAASFPYGLNKLHGLIFQLQTKIRLQTLGKTYDGRSIPMLNLGNPNSKEVIIISARVHPGQTGGSFIMQGFLKELVEDSEHSLYLKNRFLFKIVPMINIDGVVRGNFRFSAPGLDLNRKWQQPLETHHPQIHYLKEMIMKQHRERKVMMFMDLHGHSRKKNVFFYGCCRNSQDSEQVCRVKAFPYLMSELHDAFSFEQSCFQVQKDKEGTARIAMWKELKINEVYTLEASFCGSDKGGNYLENDFENIGRKLCEGIAIHFFEHKANTHPINKMAAFKAKVISDLTNSPSLLQSEHEQNSGSDSEPQRGELPPKTSKGMPKTSSKLGMNLKTKSSSKSKALKQRSQAATPDEKQYIKQKQMFEYLFQAPSQTLSSSDKKSQPSIAFRNVRVHSLSRNNYYHRPDTKILPYPQEPQPDTVSAEKNKTNLLLGWEGVQYRRVYKIAQENWKKQASGNSVVEVRGIKGNCLEIDNGRFMIPKLALYTDKSKCRRTSAEMFFKKSNKQLTLPGNDSNVHCRGRQIMF